MGGASAGGPAAGFDKLLLDVPCPTPTMAGNCNIESAEARRKSKMITFGGDPAKTYKVKLKICGVIEGRMYTGCQMNAAGEPALVCVNGMPVASNATYPILSLVVAEPMKTYYLNNRWARDDITMIQYTATFEIKGGSAVTIATDGGTNSDTYTARRNMHNYMCPDVPGIMQPFAGQFVYFTVDSVDPPI